MLKRTILDKIFTSKPVSSVTAQDEQLILWSVFGNAEVRSTLGNPGLAQDTEKRNQLFRKLNDDLLNNIDAKLRSLFQVAVTTIQASEQFTCYQKLLLDLSEDKYRSQAWSCSCLLTSLITGDTKKINYSELSQVSIIYVLVFSLDSSSNSFEYLFNLLDFTVYFAVNNKQVKTNDLLWFRLSVLFWQLSVADDPGVRKSLLEKYKIADAFKERFFKTIAFYCFNNVQDKTPVYCVEHSEKIKNFLAELCVAGTVEIKITMFIQKLLRLDVTKAQRLLMGQSSLPSTLPSKLVLYFYDQYYKYLIADIEPCPLLSIITKFVSLSTTKILAGELELSSVNSMIANCRKRLLEETTMLQATRLTLRDLQLTQQSDHERLSREVIEFKQSADLLEECREQQTRNLDDMLKELEKLDKLDNDLQILDDVKLKYYSVFSVLMCFKALKTENYLNYYCRYLFLVFKLVDNLLALWIELIKSKVDSPEIFSKILIIKRIKQCELSFHTLQGQIKTVGTELLPFSSFLIEDLIIRLNRVVNLLNTQDLQLIAKEAVLVNLIKVIGGQFNNQIESGVTAKVRNIKAI